MLVDLRNKVGLIGRLFSTDGETQSSGLDKVIVAVGIVDIACWSADLIEKVDLFTVSD
jgi:hypothetical protein